MSSSVSSPSSSSSSLLALHQDRSNSPDNHHLSFPSLPGRGRSYHVALYQANTNQVVVLGGQLHERDEEQEVEDDVCMDTLWWRPPQPPSSSSHDGKNNNDESRTDAWSKGPKLPQPLMEFAAVSCGDAVYVVGGNDPHRDRDSGEIYRFGAPDGGVAVAAAATAATATDDDDDDDASPNFALATARSGHAAVIVLNRFVVVLGGYQDMDHCLSSVEIVDLTTRTVHPGPSLVKTRAHLQACAITVVKQDQQQQHRIVVVGGENDGGLHRDLEWISYNPQAQSAMELFEDKDGFDVTWEAISNVRTGLPKCHGVVPVNDKWLLLVGRDQIEWVDLIQHKVIVIDQSPLNSLVGQHKCGVAAMPWQHETSTTTTTTPGLLLLGGEGAKNRVDWMPLQIPGMTNQQQSMEEVSQAERVETPPPTQRGEQQQQEETNCYDVHKNHDDHHSHPAMKSSSTVTVQQSPTSVATVVVTPSSEEEDAPHPPHPDLEGGGPHLVYNDHRNNKIDNNNESQQLLSPEDAALMEEACTRVQRYVEQYEEDDYQRRLERLYMDFHQNKYNLRDVNNKNEQLAPGHAMMMEWAKQVYVTAATSAEATTTTSGGGANPHYRRAQRMQRDRKLCLKLIYNMVYAWKDEWIIQQGRPSHLFAQALCQVFGVRRWKRILAVCLVLERAQCLYQRSMTLHRGGQPQQEEPQKTTLSAAASLDGPQPWFASLHLEPNTPFARTNTQRQLEFRAYLELQLPTSHGPIQGTMDDRLFQILFELEGLELQKDAYFRELSLPALRPASHDVTTTTTKLSSLLVPPKVAAAVDPSYSSSRPIPMSYHSVSAPNTPPRSVRSTLPLRSFVNMVSVANQLAAQRPSNGGERRSLTPPRHGNSNIRHPSSNNQFKHHHQSPGSYQHQSPGLHQHGSSPGYSPGGTQRRASISSAAIRRNLPGQLSNLPLTSSPGQSPVSLRGSISSASLRNSIAVTTGATAKLPSLTTEGSDTSNLSAGSNGSSSHRKSINRSSVSSRSSAIRSSTTSIRRSGIVLDSNTIDELRALDTEGSDGVGSASSTTTNFRTLGSRSPSAGVVPKYDQYGRILDDKTRSAMADRLGVCMHCGVQCSIKVGLAGIRRKPLTNDQVYKGICIRDYSDQVPKHIYQEWEARESAKQRQSFKN